uniref:Uncharacterized protein n=1 Tax=Arundo donax TaxID=35708 RepID=A0A0A9ATT2_ARUDO
MLVRAPVPWHCCSRRACRRSPHDTAAPSASYPLDSKSPSPAAARRRGSTAEIHRALLCSALQYFPSV